jgi:hypothetical protein
MLSPVVKNKVVASKSHTVTLWDIIRLYVERDVEGHIEVLVIKLLMQ